MRNPLFGPEEIPPPRRFSRAFGELLRKRIKDYYLLPVDDRFALRGRKNCEMFDIDPGAYPTGWIFQQPMRLFKD